LEHVTFEKEFISVETVYMKTLLLSPVVLFFLLFSSCSGENKGSDNVHFKKPKNANDIETHMAEIENNPDWKVMNSLAYNNNEGSTEEVIAYLNASDEAVKLEERFSDVSTGNYGKRLFYVADQKTFASKEVYFDNTLKEPAFIERISFYGKNQQPVYTRERTAPTELELDNASFQQKNPVGISIERAMQVINQQGEFATTFQGFVQSGGLTYILVGENSQDGFASSLAIQYENEDIKKLKLNERGMIGTPLQIKHQTMVDEKGLKFQVLLDLLINS
jgi:hypothetical protein